MAVAIVNYNTRELLRACLASIRGASPREVVVVDNASTDGSAEMAGDTPGVVLLANRENVGYGAAANQAIARCRAPYVLLLNADTRIEDGSLDALARYLDASPRVAVVGPRIVHPDGSLQPSCYPFPTPLNTLLVNRTLSRIIGRLPVAGGRYLRTWSHAHPRPVPCVLGAAMAIRRSAFDEIGGFDESFFMYFEEIDFCFRLARRGWQVHFAPVTTVVHVGGASTGQQRAAMAILHSASLVRFYERHYSRGRRLQVVAILKTIALARLVIDGLRLCLARQASSRRALSDDVAAWCQLLRGRPAHAGRVDGGRP